MADLRMNFCASVKTYGAAPSLVQWSDTEVPSDGLVALLFEFGNNGTIADLVRLRLKAGGSTIFDASKAQLRAWLQRETVAGYVPAEADNFLCLPLHLLDIDENDDLRYAVQFPPGAVITVELDMDAQVGGAGNARIGWIRCLNIAAEGYPTLLAKAISSLVIAGTANQVVAITPPGKVKAVLIPTAGVDKVELRIADEDLWNIRIPMLIAAQMPDNQPTGGATAHLVEPICVEVDPPRQGVVKGKTSQIQFDTAAGYTAAGKEICIFSIAELPKAQAAK